MNALSARMTLLGRDEQDSAVAGASATSLNVLRLEPLDHLEGTPGGSADLAHKGRSGTASCSSEQGDVTRQHLQRPRSYAACVRCGLAFIARTRSRQRPSLQKGWALVLVTTLLTSHTGTAPLVQKQHM
jgi:hypothetical protein